MALEPSWTLVDSAGVVHVVAGRSALSQMFGKNTKPTYNNMLELVGEGSRGVVGYLCKDGWRMLRELPWLQHKESKRIVPVVGCRPVPSTCSSRCRHGGLHLERQG